MQSMFSLFKILYSSTILWITSLGLRVTSLRLQGFYDRVSDYPSQIQVSSI